MNPSDDRALACAGWAALVAAGYLQPGYGLLTLAAAVVFLRHRDNAQRLQASAERKLGERAGPRRAGGPSRAQTHG